MRSTPELQKHELPVAPVRGRESRGILHVLRCHVNSNLSEFAIFFQFDAFFTCFRCFLFSGQPPEAPRAEQVESWIVYRPFLRHTEDL